MTSSTFHLLTPKLQSKDFGFYLIKVDCVTWNRLATSARFQSFPIECFVVSRWFQKTFCRTFKELSIDVQVNWISLKFGRDINDFPRDPTQTWTEFLQRRAEFPEFAVPTLRPDKKPETDYRRKSQVSMNSIRFVSVLAVRGRSTGR